MAQSAWSEAAHIFPIVSLLFSDLLAPNALLSLSTDGRLCQFAAGRGEGASGGPRDPTRSLQLRAGRAVLPSAAAFSRVDASRLYVGCEEGALAVVDVNGDKESAPGSRVAAHYAYVSALDVHPSLDAPLLLTASFDGTVKLWATEVRLLLPHGNKHTCMPRPKSPTPTPHTHPCRPRRRRCWRCWTRWRGRRWWTRRGHPQTSRRWWRRTLTAGWRCTSWGATR